MRVKVVCAEPLVATAMSIQVVCAGPLMATAMRVGVVCAGPLMATAARMKVVCVGSLVVTAVRMKVVCVRPLVVIAKKVVRVGVTAAVAATMMAKAQFVVVVTVKVTIAFLAVHNGIDRIGRRALETVRVHRAMPPVLLSLAAGDRCLAC